MLGKGSTAPSLTGFRIRTKYNMDKSPEFHKYQPEYAGTNAERIINLANLFDNVDIKDSQGWSEWSREMVFDDINFVNSNGGVTVVFNTKETPNYWINFDGITNLKQFFDTMIQQNSQIQYLNN